MTAYEAIKTMKKKRPKFELVTDYPITEYSCGLRPKDLLRLRNDLEITNPDGVVVSVISAGEEAVVLTGTEGIVWVRWLSTLKRHTWNDDDSIFEYFDHVGRCDDDS